MCRGKNDKNPRRCSSCTNPTPAQRARTNARRRAARAYRAQAAELVMATTGDASLAAQVRRAPMTAMREIVEACGEDPDEFGPREYAPSEVKRYSLDAKMNDLVKSIENDDPPLTPAKLNEIAEKEAAAAVDIDTGVADELADLGDHSSYRDLMYDSPGAKQVAAARDAWLDYRERAQVARGEVYDYDPILDPEGYHAACCRAQDASLDEVVVRNKYEKLADEQARAIHAALDGTLPRFENTEIGEMTLYGEAEEGSVGWHEMRQDGFGASSILHAAGYEMSNRTGKLKRVAPGQRPWHLEEIMDEKTADLDPSDFAGDITDGGAANRGHMWEEAILVEHAASSGANIAIGKGTWKGREEFAVINLDGIEVDEDGKAIGAFECKKIDNAEPWIDPATGDLRPPAKYAAQALYIADQTGFDKVTLVADVAGEKVVHTYHRGESIDGTPGGKTIADILPDARRAWDEVKEAKAAKADGRERKKFTRDLRRPIGTTGLATRAAVDNVTGLLGGQMTRDQVKDELDRRRVETGSMDSAVRSLLRDKFDRSKLVMVGVDGETAGAVDGGSGDPRAFAPAWSSWIETGIVVHDGSGRESSSLSKLHGVDPRIRALNGTGAEDVHNISPEMVAGKPRFEDDHDDVRAALLAGNCIVAHNASFEQKHLHAKVKGLKGQRPWVDTQWLSAHFMPRDDKNANNRLASFAPENGVPYEGAHRAEADTRMMMQAMENFFARDKWWEGPDS